jgi:hypothetical protein
MTMWTMTSAQAALPDVGMILGRAMVRCRLRRGTPERAEVEVLDAEGRPTGQVYYHSWAVTLEALNTDTYLRRNC